MEITQEEEKIGPNYMKLVQTFVYLLVVVGKNSNNYNNNKMKQKSVDQSLELLVLARV